MTIFFRCCLIFFKHFFLQKKVIGTGKPYENKKNVFEVFLLFVIHFRCASTFCLLIKNDSSSLIYLSKAERNLIIFFVISSIYSIINWIWIRYTHTNAFWQIFINFCGDKNFSLWLYCLPVSGTQKRDSSCQKFFSGMKLAINVNLLSHCGPVVEILINVYPISIIGFIIINKLSQIGSHNDHTRRLLLHVARCPMKERRNDKNLHDIDIKFAYLMNYFLSFRFFFVVFSTKEMLLVATPNW